MSILNNKSILAALDEIVFGHYEAKKALITMLNRSKLRHFQKYMRGVEDDNLINPLKILIIAASGTGKTFLIESLRNIVHFPFVRVDATQMNPAGSSGGVKVTDLKKQIITEANNCCEHYPNFYYSVEGAIDQTVVFVDEIDKLGMSFESSGNWNKHVQSNYLTLFDNKAEFAGLSFVFAGAFNEITTISPKQKDAIGFTPQKNQKDDALLDERVVAEGLIPELVGRMNCIIELDKFSLDDLLKILKQVVLPKKLRDLAAYNIFDANIEEDVLYQIAYNCSKSGQGVRYLQRQVDKIFLDLEYETGIAGVMFDGYGV